MTRKFQTLWMYCVIVVVVASTCVGLDVYRFVYKPMPLKEHETVIFCIDKSSSAKTFVQVLQSQQLIQSNQLCLNLIRLQGLSTRLKAGVYQVKRGESVEQLLQRVVAGDVLQETFRIIEGTTQQQIASNLKQAPYLKYDDKDWHVLKKADDAPHALEGLLLADTYRYPAGSQAKALLVQAHEHLKAYLMDAWEHRHPSLPYKNPYELLIVASILEKETAISAERRLISGIIVNRLSHRMPLQMDLTVIYGLGAAYRGKLTHEHLQIDSPYNSYRYRGLPPTPIAMVGKDAIDAASHPEMTAYLYFVAKGDGTHLFSETYEQQRQAIDRYLRKN